nr:probable inactive receptor kinase RLK902 isoform X1 [Ipomoea trifida]
MAWSPDSIVKSKLVFFGDGDGYELEDLLRSTAGVLGKGTFGTSYKSELPEKSAVAVKRLKIGCLPVEEFTERVHEVGKMMVHENLLPLKAYCWHHSEILLVYDHMSMGSLAFRLHGNDGKNKASLNWEVRTSIAYGVANAIQSLHAQGSTICHGNIRSSNVFLTNFLEVRVSEFCLARLLSPDSKLDLVPGYRAPEVTSPHQVSHQSDVYSFGVLLLELLTGKAPLDAFARNNGVDLPNWVRAMFREKPISDVFDSTLAKAEGNAEQLVQLLQVAICCTFQYPNKRPSMAAVADQIKKTCSLWF